MKTNARENAPDLGGCFAIGVVSWVNFILCALVNQAVENCSLQQTTAISGYMGLTPGSKPFTIELEAGCGMIQIRNRGTLREGVEDPSRGGE